MTLGGTAAVIPLPRGAIAMRLPLVHSRVDQSLISNSRSLPRTGIYSRLPSFELTAPLHPMCERACWARCAPPPVRCRPCPWSAPAPDPPPSAASPSGRSDARRWVGVSTGTPTTHDSCSQHTSREAAFFCPEKPPIVMSLATTRWHGTCAATGIVGWTGCRVSLLCGAAPGCIAWRPSEPTMSAGYGGENAVGESRWMGRTVSKAIAALIPLCPVSEKQDTHPRHQHQPDCGYGFLRRAWPT